MSMTRKDFIERWGCRQEIISFSGNKNQRDDLDLLIASTKKIGISAGLRMAAEMVGGIYKCEGVKKLILAKAKEVEERKIESKTKVL